jgi:histidinol-phosphate aminotransferase
MSGGHVLLTEGSISALDLLIRVFCEPFADHIVVTPPTFAFYARAARNNNVSVVNIPLRGDNLDVLLPERVVASAPKLVFLCRPNNPVGTVVDIAVVERIAEMLDRGLVVIDEAYAEFCSRRSTVGLMSRHPNVVVTRTFSKAWGLAGGRIGAVLADSSILDALRMVQLTYGVSAPALELISEALDRPERMRADVDRIVAARDELTCRLAALEVVRRVYPSEANFVLVELANDAAMRALADAAIVVADTSSDLPGTVRIAVGPDESNERLLSVLQCAAAPD